MAKRPYNRERYDALVQAYRDCPDNHAAAGRQAGCTQQTAKRMWEQGWPGIPWAIPIRDRLVQEREDARLELARQTALARNDADALRAKARQDSIESHAAEGAMVRLARSDATGLLASVGRLLPAVAKLAESFSADVLSAKELDRNEAARLLGQVAKVTKEALAAAQIAVELERLHLGAPTQIVGVTDVSAMSSEEAAREIEQAAAALARARKLGLLEDVTTVDVTPKR